MQSVAGALALYSNGAVGPKLRSHGSHANNKFDYFNSQSPTKGYLNINEIKSLVRSS